MTILFVFMLDQNESWPEYEISTKPKNYESLICVYEFYLLEKETALYLSGIF